MALDYQQDVITDYKSNIAGSSFDSDDDDDDEEEVTGGEAPIRIFPQVNLYRGSSVVHTAITECEVDSNHESDPDDPPLAPAPPGNAKVPPPPPRTLGKDVPPPPPRLSKGPLGTHWKVELERKAEIDELFAKYAGNILDDIAVRKAKISSDIERDNVYGVIRMVFEGGFASLIKHLDKRCQLLYSQLKPSSLPTALINSATDRLKSRIFTLCSDLSKVHRNSVSFLETTIQHRSYVPCELEHQIKQILSEGRPSSIVGELTSIAEQLPILESADSASTFAA